MGALRDLQIGRYSDLRTNFGRLYELRHGWLTKRRKDLQLPHLLGATRTSPRSRNSPILMQIHSEQQIQNPRIMRYRAFEGVGGRPSYSSRPLIGSASAPFSSTTAIKEFSHARGGYVASPRPPLSSGIHNQSLACVWRDQPTVDLIVSHRRLTNTFNTPCALGIGMLSRENLPPLLSSFGVV